jgi:hypothetical protein
MRPTVPDTPALRAVRTFDHSTEVKVAQLFLSAAETYVAWAQLGEKLSADLDAIDKIGRGDNGALAALDELLSPPTEKDQPTGVPSLRRSILMVMQLSPNRTWRKADLMGALMQRGWAPKGIKPTATLSTRLAEMIERGEVVRVSVGHYKLAGVARMEENLAERSAQGTPQGAEETAQ